MQSVRGMARNCPLSLMGKDAAKALLLLSALLPALLPACLNGSMYHVVKEQWRVDDEIGRRVEDALLETRQLNLSRIEVDVESGVVYLVGEVDSGDGKAKAQEVARTVGGVKQVINKLEVEP